MKELLVTSLLILFTAIITNGQSCYSKKNCKDKNNNGWQSNVNNYKDSYKERRQTKRSAPENPKKAIFVEWRGNGIGKSINFDSRFSKTRNGLGMRVGLGGTQLDYDREGEGRLSYDALTIPAEINYLFGKRRHSIETGVGFTTILDKNDDDFNGQAFLNLGYRFKPIRKGIVFRVNYTPTFNTEGVQFGKTGISVGWGF